MSTFSPERQVRRSLGTVALVACVAIGGATQKAFAHCEIPCGIYGDRMRSQELREHFTTIEKSMKTVTELSQAKGQKNFNQIVRWVNNKELHANKVQEIVYQYFMNQRIKPTKEGEDGYEEYVEQLTLLHHMLVSAMKCKQTTDLQHVNDLQEALDAFDKAYFQDPEHDPHTH